ncbi:uncharacterized protein M437DRAFT_71256 [Aureobasidium melanogenum CBS 110374]|uniref:Uncharacterized protein n=1 Tax=Aureobasidium melanogenum (strain CBS 110374) TaxID=1043003 RepID=A0A074WYI2_AURM1|nr:uncharacterized protein M437DRAFT_71256 [Aureobasidium melanogenum CBS 110374]KEQ67441.1 hypothetical protein M437DRAFT_71256 [Aureobasidium melanogenum CBS 110374]
MKTLRRRHKHTISPRHRPTISASTPPHHHTRRATATPFTSGHEWEDLRKDYPAQEHTTVAAYRFNKTTGRKARTTRSGSSSHHPLFLPQIFVPKPKDMRTETNRRNLHYVLLRAD